jgi:LuxR family transcriptional regulator, quorum-sensing system regulator BjaR1
VWVEDEFGAARMRSRRYLTLDPIYDISRLTLLSEIGPALADAMAKFGFTALGINGLPPPAEGSDPRILAEIAPEGFRDLYIGERFYQVDHICAHARAAYEPFRFSEAPYDMKDSRGHERFMQALESFDMGKGLIVPVERSTNIPACVWLAGRDPDLDKDTKLAVESIALFTASKARALSRPLGICVHTKKLTPREREVLRWISAGKTSWEISMISGSSERAIDKIIAGAMIKLDAITRTQAVVNAIRLGEIEL